MEQLSAQLEEAYKTVQGHMRGVRNTRSNSMTGRPLEEVIVLVTWFGCIPPDVPRGRATVPPTSPDHIIQQLQAP